jgi:hypothetical protein
MAAGAAADIAHCSGGSGTGGIRTGIASETGGGSERGLGFRPLLSAVSDFEERVNGGRRKNRWKLFAANSADIAAKTDIPSILF